MNGGGARFRREKGGKWSVCQLLTFLLKSPAVNSRAGKHSHTDICTRSHHTQNYSASPPPGEHMSFCLVFSCSHFPSTVPRHSLNHLAVWKCVWRGLNLGTGLNPVQLWGKTPGGRAKTSAGSGVWVMNLPPLRGVPSFHPRFRFLWPQSRFPFKPGPTPAGFFFFFSAARWSQVQLFTGSKGWSIFKWRLWNKPLFKKVAARFSELNALFSTFREKNSNALICFGWHVGKAKQLNFSVAERLLKLIVTGFFPSWAWTRHHPGPSLKEPEGFFENAKAEH